MSFFVAVLLGFVQGITEFLPVSSSGHLTLLEKLFGVELDAVFLNVLLHVATLFAVCLCYRKTLFYMIKNPFCKQNLFLLVATIPAVVFVACFGFLFEGFFNSTLFVGIGFLISAVLLVCAQLVSKTESKPLNMKTVLFMGGAQALAVFPGLSRSGTTFAFGVVAGSEKQTVLDFSFLMSIPIILASLVYELCFKPMTFNVDWFSVAVAFVVAFLTALCGIKFMQKLVKKASFWWFAIYLAVVGVIAILFI